MGAFHRIVFLDAYRAAAQIVRGGLPWDIRKVGHA